MTKKFLATFFIIRNSCLLYSYGASVCESSIYRCNGDNGGAGFDSGNFAVNNLRDGGVAGFPFDLSVVGIGGLNTCVKLFLCAYAQFNGFFVYPIPINSPLPQVFIARVLQSVFAT